MAKHDTPIRSQSHRLATGEAAGGNVVEEIAGGAYCYPSPTQNAVTLSLQVDEKHNFEVNLYDVMGRIVLPVYSGSLPSGKHEIITDAVSLGAGTYFYCIKSNTSTENLKFIKQ